MSVTTIHKKFLKSSIATTALLLHSNVSEMITFSGSYVMMLDNILLIVSEFVVIHAKFSLKYCCASSLLDLIDLILY
ncbi:hypothetical protein J5751_01340 [bacterium]|nr:hypothetical protein [bacterium]